MNTVKGERTGKVLLTLHFVQCGFMLTFLRDNNSSKSVIETFNSLHDKLGEETFKRLFPMLLTDNGTEFSNPLRIKRICGVKYEPKCFTATLIVPTKKEA